ncbi:hypothetical protein WICPIJ_005393, partial [Wickerhamomyces pijperi]
HFTKPNCLDDGIGMPDIQPVVNPSQILLDDPFVEEVETAVIVLDERVNKKHRVGIRREFEVHRDTGRGFGSPQHDPVGITFTVQDGFRLCEVLIVIRR